MRASPLLLVLAFGCGDGGTLGGRDPKPTDTDPPDSDSDSDSDSDTDTDTDTDTELPGPLSALSWGLHPQVGSLVTVSWEQEAVEQAWVEYSFDPGEWHASPATPGVAGPNSRLLVGIPFGMTAHWRVVTTSAVVDGPLITTADPDPDLPVATLRNWDEKRAYGPGNYLLTSINQRTGGWTGGTYWAFIVDRKGRPVWAIAAPDQHWVLYTQVSVTGDHILWDEATYWSDFDAGRGSQVHRTWLDAPIASIPTPGLHHAFVELPDGTLAWGSQAHGFGEALVEKAPGQKDETVIWTCAEDWPNVYDCESNCVFYEPTYDTYLYSFYTNSSIVAIYRPTGKSLWWAGTVPGGYDFDPVESHFSWQHGLSWTDDGNLLLSTEGGFPTQTWVREYEVDNRDQTLNEVWSYNSEERADTNGDARRLPNGNTLHVVGSAGHIKEVDRAGEVVWHLDFEAEKLLGRGEYIEDLYTLVAP